MWWVLGTWAVGAAMAEPPDQLVHLAGINTTNGGQVERMTVSPSGDLLVGRTQGNLEGWLYDLDSWKGMTFDDCDVTGVAPIDLVDDDGNDTTELWTSCADGSVIVKVYDGEALSDLRDAKGNVVRYSGVDDSLSDIWFDPRSRDKAGGEYIYALSVADSAGTAVIHVIDPFDSEFTLLDGGLSQSFPKPLSWPGYNEGVIVNGRLFVAHGGQDMSTLVLGLSNAGSVPGVQTLINCNDLAPSPFDGVYCVDARGQVAEFRAISSTFVPLPLGLTNPNAVCASPDIKDGWLAITGLQVRVWRMSNGVLDDQTPVFESAEDADNPINDMVTVDDYLFGGGPGGRLHIVTARPWFEIQDQTAVYMDGVLLETTTVTDGDALELRFTVDEDVDYEVFLGGNRFGFDGISLGTGSAAEGELESFPFDVSLDFAEGENRIYVIAENDRSLQGHTRLEVQVDNPPRPPSLTNANLEFGDGQLTLVFDGIPDEDLASYTIFISNQAWEASDFPDGGGPVLDGLGPINRAAAGGENQTVTIKPLENDVTYYIGVLATDQGGKVGPMSRIIEGTPRQTFTAAQLANDDGGSPCSTSGTTLGFGAATLGMLALMRRRRRMGAVLGGAAALVLVSLAGPSVAQAQEEMPSFWSRRDLTPARGNFELRYGVINLQDARIVDVYNESPTNLLLAEVGPQFFRVAELDVGFGFFQELSFTVDGEGTRSGERTMLTWWPLALDVTLRGHILDEQPVVPTFRYGWDYVIWSEKSDNDLGTKDTIRGAKFGTHWGLGLQLLLDMFQPRRSSLLEAQTGINDSWLTFEWRRQTVDDRERPWSGAVDGPRGLKFSGDAFMLGLKLDY